MPDLGVMLRKAREAVVFSGNTGNGGNGPENCKSINRLVVPNIVPSADTPMGTVGTNQAGVSTVPTDIEAVGTEANTEKSIQYQCSTKIVPTVPTVPNENSNSPEFIGRADPNRCHVCGGRETGAALFVAVLTSRPGEHHWLHHTCHPEHIRRCAERRNV